MSWKPRLDIFRIGHTRANVFVYIVTWQCYVGFRPNIVRVINSRTLRRARNVARMEEGMIASEILKSDPTVKRQIGRPRRRGQENVSMAIKGRL